MHVYYESNKNNGGYGRYYMYMYISHIERIIHTKDLKLHRLLSKNVIINYFAYVLCADDFSPKIVITTFAFKI